MIKYDGKVVYVDGKPFGIAKRYSPSIGLHSQDTGRWSQKDLPAAQLPSKMRAINGIDVGYAQLGYDLSNVELRVVATLSGDQTFLDAFALGWDLHSINCCEFFRMDYPPSRIKADIHTGKVCAEWRKQYDWKGEDDSRRKWGKIANFRLLYGGSPKSMYKIPGTAAMGLSRDSAELAAWSWLSAHPALNAFWNTVGTEAMQRFVVRNAYGRRRVLTSQEEQSRYREGVNHPVQSHVSDLINQIVVKTFLACNNCLTMEELRRLLLIQPSKVELVGQMHDSLLFSFPLDDFSRLANVALNIAEEPTVLQGKTFQIPVSCYTKGVENFQRS